APPAPPYRIVASRLFRNGRIGAHVYRDGMRALRRARPDIVQAEVEPWSLAALQCALAAPATRLVIFTWENLEAPLRRASRALEARVSAWPRDKARCVGAVTDTDVPEYLAALDALVLPSRTTATWAEQFGHVLIEAMAAGVPVVGSSSGAIPDVVGDAGIIVPEGDAAALRRALGTLLADPALRARLSERGQDRVQAHYAHAVVARELAALYRRLAPA